MKIKIPAYEPLLKGNEHLRHGEIDIDLGEDVVKVVRCKDCLFYFPPFCNRPKNRPNHTHAILPNDFCSYGERKDGTK